VYIIALQSAHVYYILSLPPFFLLQHESKKDVTPRSPPDTLSAAGSSTPSASLGTHDGRATACCADTATFHSVGSDSLEPRDERNVRGALGQGKKKAGGVEGVEGGLKRTDMGALASMSGIM
jgi:hypothetical protein